jgi:sugar (glycoside-pentoside-hexuronide) transporter
MNKIEMKDDVTSLESWIVPVGAMTQGILFNMVSAFALFYYTDVVGLAPFAIGIMFFISRIWDGINDPLMGVIADNTHTRWGKFKPYIMFGPIVVSILAVMLFSAASVPAGMKFAYVCATYVLFSMAYTLVDIPIWSFSTTMSRDANRVTSILSRTELLTTIGGILPGVLTMPLVAVLAINMADGFRNTAMLFALVALVVTSLAGFISKERVHTPRKEMSLKDMFSIVFKNRMLLLASSSLIFMSMLTIVKIMILPYYAIYNLGRGELVSLIMIACSVPGLLGILAMPMIVRKFDKKNVGLLFMVITVILHGIAFFAGFKSLTIILILHGAASLFMFPAGAIVVTMFGDCVLYTEWKSKVRLEGMIFSFRTLTGKFASSLAGLLVSMVLTAIGYVANQTQTQESLQGMHSTMTLGCALIVVLAIVPMLFYTLTNDKMTEIQKDLREKGAASAPEEQTPKGPAPAPLNVPG